MSHVHLAQHNRHYPDHGDAGVLITIPRIFNFDRYPHVSAFTQLVYLCSWCSGSGLYAWTAGVAIRYTGNALCHLHFGPLRTAALPSWFETLF